MIGTLINTATILIGGALGIILGARLPERYRSTVIAGLGLFTLAYGVQMFFSSKNPLIVVGSLLVGAIIGELLHLEDGLHKIGEFLESKFSREEKVDGAQTRFLQGFLTASLVFCIGPMAILGSIKDGLTGDYNILAVKAILDGFMSLALASSLGAGVLFSSLMILVYQGGISLLAAQVNSVVTSSMMAEMNATGGVILLGIAISSILEIKKFRVASFLPAIFLAPIIAAIAAMIAK